MTALLGNRESEAARDHRVDADDAARGVGERAAGISRSEANAGLHPGLRTKAGERPTAWTTPVVRAPTETQRIADGDREFAWAQTRRIRRRGCRQVFAYAKDAMSRT